MSNQSPLWYIVHPDNGGSCYRYVATSHHRTVPVVERTVVEDTPYELAVMGDVHIDRFVVPSSVLFVTEFDAGLIKGGDVDKGTLKETIVAQEQIVHPFVSAVSSYSMFRLFSSRRMTVVLSSG